VNEGNVQLNESLLLLELSLGRKRNVVFRRFWIAVAEELTLDAGRYIEDQARCWVVSPEPGFSVGSSRAQGQIGIQLPDPLCHRSPDS